MQRREGADGAGPASAADVGVDECDTPPFRGFPRAEVVDVEFLGGEQLASPPLGNLADQLRLAAGEVVEQLARGVQSGDEVLDQLSTVDTLTGRIAMPGAATFVEVVGLLAIVALNVMFAFNRELTMCDCGHRDKNHGRD